MKNKSGDNDKYKKRFDSFQNENYSEADAQNVFDNEDKIKDLSSKGPLKKYLDYIALFISMLKDYFKGNYKEIPKGSIVAIIGTLLYILSPVDIILDAIPFIGLIDDAAIVLLCIKFVSLDIKRYEKWKYNSERLSAMLE